MAVSPSKDQPRVVLIEDQSLIRGLFIQILQRERGWTQIEGFSNGTTGLQHCLATPPDLLIVDLDLPGTDGREIITQLKRHAPQTRILVLTGSLSARPAQLMELGVEGFVDKTADYHKLLRALDVVLSGGVFFSVAPVNRDSAPPHSAAGPDPRVVLSPEELAIARRVVAGLSSKEIGSELNLTARSVDKHRANIMEKLGVRQVAGLVRLCVLNGVV